MAPRDDVVARRHATNAFALRRHLVNWLVARRLATDEKSAFFRRVAPRFDSLKKTILVIKDLSSASVFIVLITLIITFFLTI